MLSYFYSVLRITTDASEYLKTFYHPSSHIVSLLSSCYYDYDTADETSISIAPDDILPVSAKLDKVERRSKIRDLVDEVLI